MPKALTLWNGRGYCCQNQNDSRWNDVPSNDAPKAFVAAYSRADARRVIAEYCGKMPPDSELAKYFSKDAWGNSMDGVTPERGLWLAFFRAKPVRVV